MPRQRNSSSSCESTNSEINSSMDRIQGKCFTQTNHENKGNNKLAIDQMMACSCQTTHPCQDTLNCLYSSSQTTTEMQKIIINNHQNGQEKLNNCLDDDRLNGYKREAVLINKINEQNNSSHCKVENNNNLDVNQMKRQLVGDLKNGLKYNRNYVNMKFVQSISLYENVEFKDTNEKISNGKISSEKKSLMPLQEEYSKQDQLYKINDYDDNYVIMNPILNKESNQKKNSLENKLIIQSKRNINVNQKITNKIVFQKLKERFFNQRSKSLERKKINWRRHSDFAIPSSCPSSPSMNLSKNRRKFFTGNKSSLKSKMKSFSIDNVSPSNPSSEHNLITSFNPLHRLPFHRSAECLKHKTIDYMSSDEEEEDIQTSSQITIFCSTPLKVA